MKRHTLYLTASLAAAIVLTATSARAALTYEQTVLADNPVGYWQFEETSGATAFNSSAGGSTYDGTYNGGVTLGGGGAAAIGGNSADFNGSSGYVQLPGTWGGTGWGAATVEAWVNTTAPITTDFQCIVATPNGGFAHFQLHSGGSTGVYASGGTGSTWISPPPAATPTGVWRHVALVAESGDLRTYVNGVRQAGATGTFTQINASAGPGGVRIGNGHIGTRWFKGQMDEVAIYDTALSDAQVAAHFLASLPPYAAAVMADSPSTYYRFNETTGTTATDMAGGAHGTYGGGVDMTSTSPFGGALGAAKGFDGSSGHVDVPDLGGGANSQFSVEMWIKPSYPGGLHALYASDSWGGGRVHMNLSGSNVELAVSGNSTPWPTQSLASIAPAGTWNHLVVTYDVPANEGKFYVNGQHVGTTVTNGSTGGVFGPATIAAWYQSPLTRYFGGDIDEFAIYQGTVLSSTQVAAHYNAAIDPGVLQPVETGGPFSAGNVAAAATAFTKNEAGGGMTAKLNDGTFGNSSSWYGTADQSFAGLAFGSSQTIDHVGFGRSNTADFPDRSLGNYTIQYTTVASPGASTPDSDWITLGTLKYDNASPDQPGLRHLYSFPTVDATGVRILTDHNEFLQPPTHYIAIDEIEAYHGHPLTLIETGGQFDTNPMSPNLARRPTATVFGSGEAGAPHTFAGLVDGVYGNSNSWGHWISQSFVGVDLDGLFPIDRVAWGRDNGGEATQYTDRTEGTYTLEYTQALDPQTTSDWITIGTLIYPDFYQKSLRHLYEFDTVYATGVRLSLAATGLPIVIDELEIYQAIPEPSTWVLAMLGAAGLGLVSRRRRRSE